jgi:hypothetical protein
MSITDLQGPMNHYCLEIVDSWRMLLMFGFSYRIHRLFAEWSEPNGMDLAWRMLAMPSSNALLKNV